jgi:hypothetical protein
MAADTPGTPMKSANGSNPRALKITGLHQSSDNAAPAVPNPKAADVRGQSLTVKVLLGVAFDYIFPALGCDIKGNISRSGERIYHLPKFYSKTDKAQHGAPLEAVVAIVDSVQCAPFRQALIASKSVMVECGLKPGDLREKIIVDFDRLYDLPSVTVIKIGEAMLRLTFHCEPTDRF